MSLNQEQKQKQIVTKCPRCKASREEFHFISKTGRKLKTCNKCRQRNKRAYVKLKTHRLQTKDNERQALLQNIQDKMASFNIDKEQLYDLCQIISVNKLWDEI